MVLVDTSVWIDYFRGGDQSHLMDRLFDENKVCTNEIILAELIPYFTLKQERNIIKAINKLQPAPLQIDWSEIIDFQVACLQNGANGIGIPDLIIAQNARQHHYKFYSLDKHFRLLHDVIQVQLYTI